MCDLLQQRLRPAGAAAAGSAARLARTRTCQLCWRSRTSPDLAPLVEWVSGVELVRTGFQAVVVDAEEVVTGPVQVLAPLPAI